MAVEKSPDVKTGKRVEKSGTTGIDALSLEEFKSGLTQRGFEVSSRSNSIYLNPNIPGYRIVFGKRVVRLEKENQSGIGRKWQLDTSYSISRQLRIAFNAVDQLHFEPDRIDKRIEIVSIGEIISFLVLGSVLFVGGFLFVLIPEPLLGWFIGALFLPPGIWLLVQVTKWMILRKRLPTYKFQTVAADVIGRQMVSDSGLPPYSKPSYSITIGFTPSKLASSGQRIWIRAQVNEHMYKSYVRGSTVQARYASEDPRLVIFEGE